MKQNYVYLMINKSKTLYIGVTNNLEKRAYEHKNEIIKGFSSKYKINKLVYFEVFDDVTNAIARERQLKGWLRKKKIELIESFNPEWKDLTSEWE